LDHNSTLEFVPELNKRRKWNPAT